jgi:hypothetical protein
MGYIIKLYFTQYVNWIYQIQVRFVGHVPIVYHLTFTGGTLRAVCSSILFSLYLICTVFDVSNRTVADVDKSDIFGLIFLAVSSISFLIYVVKKAGFHICAQIFHFLNVIFDCFSFLC